MTRQASRHRTVSPPSGPLTRQSLLHAVDTLAARDQDLARVVERIGPPPLWDRAPGFATLLRIVLEQQVSLASARATYARLQKTVGRVTARRVARLSLGQLRRAGITRQKSEYCLALAARVADGVLDLSGMVRADDETVRQALMEVRGIGTWTADVYLLMALRRPDVWPEGDLALAEAVRQVKRLRTRPSNDQLQRLVATWRPWRSVAARVLWHHYLTERRVRGRESATCSDG